MTIIGLIYFIAGYWAVGQTLWANTVMFGDPMQLFFKRLILGIFLGWILIPVALIKLFLTR